MHSNNVPHLAFTSHDTPEDVICGVFILYFLGNEVHRAAIDSLQAVSCLLIHIQYAHVRATDPLAEARMITYALIAMRQWILFGTMSVNVLIFH